MTYFFTRNVPRRKRGRSQDSSMLHRAPIVFAQPWRSFLLGILLGKATSGKEGRYGALRSRDMGWRRDHFRGLGELECEAQLCLATGERL